MTTFLKGLIVILVFVTMSAAFAEKEKTLQTEDTSIVSAPSEQKIESQNSSVVTAPNETAPEVGKHANVNMDASSMILALLMVLALVVISALLLKRFNFVQANTSQLKVVASLSLGAKERLVVVQVGEQQLALGVTTQQITLLETLAEPLSTTSNASLPLTGNVLSFLQKVSPKPSKSK